MSVPAINIDDVHNVVEEMVSTQLTELVEKNSPSFCHCNICLLDIAAIVLNKIHPKYEANFVERSLPHVGHQEQLDYLSVQVSKELPKAITLTDRQPHH